MLSFIYEVMWSDASKRFPYMVRKNACAIAYFKNRYDAVAWCESHCRPHESQTEIR